MERLLDKRPRHIVPATRMIVEYLVRWKDYGPEDDSWEPASNIEKILMDEYEATHHATIHIAARSTRKSARRRT